MPRFFRRLAECVFDEEDLIRRTHELADFVEAASRVYSLKAGNVIAVGYSNGANIATSTLLLRPGTLAGAALFRPMVPLVPEQKPDLKSVPIFIAAGRRDFMVPASNTERLATMLKDAGASITLRWHEGGHELSRDEINEAASWLEQVKPRMNTNEHQ